MTIPGEEEMRTRIRSFLLRSGLNHSEFCDQIGYSSSAFGQFLSGRYDSHHATEVNTRNLRAACKEYMDLHEINDSFMLTGPHHATASFEEVRRAALNALRRGTAYLVDGPPGTEKTHSLRHIEQEIRERNLGRFVYVYARVNHTPGAFLQECCCAAGVPNRGTIDQLLRKLRFFLGKGRTVLAVDEAQHLDHAGLEVLRQLLDLPPHFGVILAGSHDLTQRLSHWTMEQWRSRLRKTIYLNGPSKAESRRILRAEIGDLSDADCDATIKSCTSRAVRMNVVRGKATEEPFEYISARDLFGAIERAQESLASSINSRKKEAVA
jgi:DNA transposition AAA+ family ATPase